MLPMDRRRAFASRKRVRDLVDQPEVRAPVPERAAQDYFAAYGIYDVDGPSALRHLDLPLDIPELNAIQSVPGEGNETWRASKIEERRRQCSIDSQTGNEEKP